MNIIDFTKNGGFRFKQFTLRKMQEAYFHILKAFIAFCNVPETGNFIISGCRVVGPDITDGYLYMNGDLCKFTQSPGTLASLIKKNIVNQTLGFKNGNDEQVFRYTNAVVDLIDGELLSLFVRVSPVFDDNYVHTDSNFTVAEKTKLATIETGAQVNVKPNWNATPGTDSEILNRPNGIITQLWSGVLIIGNLDPGNANLDDIVTASFPDVGTTDYQVLGTFVSMHATSPIYDNDFTWIIDNQTQTSFDVCISEIESWVQDIKFIYKIIPN